MITTSTPLAASGKGRLLTLWILSALVALTFVGAGAAKLAGAAVMVDLFAKVGLGQWSCSSPSRGSSPICESPKHQPAKAKTWSLFP